MKISSDRTSLYDCIYRIAVSYKFKTIIENKEKLRPVVYQVLADREQPLQNIEVTKEGVSFELTVQPSESVVSVVNSIKREISAKANSEKIVELSPLFSTAFMCNTVATEPDPLGYREALKSSYRSKKGELH